MYRCKITVLQKDYYPDLAEKYAPFLTESCPMMQVGDEFVTSGMFGNECPEHFCPHAWTGIKKYAQILASGGTVYMNGHRHISCCNDGVRPVFFYLETIEDDTKPPVQSKPKRIPIPNVGEKYEKM